MPGGHLLLGIEAREQIAGLRPPEGDGTETRPPIPAEQTGEQPFADSAVPVVEDDPAVLADGQRAAAQASATSRIIRG